MRANKNTYESLVGMQFWFSAFHELNDPYELMIADCCVSQNSRIRYEFRSGDNPNGVFCLSDNPNNILMWQHYADEHKGIVVEFETEADTDFFHQLLEVEYVQNPPVLNDSMAVKDLIKCKSCEMKHEREWRVFGFRGLRNIKPQAIKSITYGHRFPLGCFMPGSTFLDGFPQNSKKFFSKIDGFFFYRDKKSFFQKFPHIEFYQSKIQQGRYLMERDHFPRS